MKAMIALAIKDLRLLLRDRANAFFTFVFPLLLAVFFGWVFSGMYGSGDEGRAPLPIAVVNLDAGPASDALLRDLQADASLKVAVALSVEEGEDLVRKRKVRACVVIPEDFDKAASSVFSGGGMKLRVILDPTAHAEGGLLTGKLYELGFKRLQHAFSDPAAMRASLDQSRAALEHAAGLTPAQKTALLEMFERITTAQEALATPGGDGANPMGGWRPIEVETSALSSAPDRPRAPTSSYAVSFPQGVVWGLLGCVMAFAISITAERSQGTLLRLRAAPIGHSAILAGKALACFIACIVVQALLLLLAVGPFGVDVPDWRMIALVVFATSFGFTGLMMLLAGLSRTEGAAQGLGRAVVLVLAMIGGGTVPLFILPKGVQTMSKVSPFTWATISIEGALWRGFDYADMLLPIAVLAAFGVIGFIVGVSAMNWTEG